VEERFYILGKRSSKDNGEKVMNLNFEKWIPGEGECELEWDKITNEYEEIEYGMEKKKYIKPEMEEVELQQEGALLSESYEEGEMGSIIPTDINQQV
jgi:hypothetical protein